MSWFISTQIPGSGHDPQLEGRTFVFAAFVALLIVVSAPVFSTVLPPLVDYPNHLARMHLLAEGGNQFYAVHWAPLPNLAADILVPPLTHLIGLDLAGKLFLVLTFALMAGGAVWLNRAATGSWRAWPLLVFLLLYDRILLWGFINYLFGLGVALCGLAIWLVLDDRPGWRVPVSSLAALVCFVSHIEAFGIYALALAGIESSALLKRWRARRYRDAAWQLGLAAIQFILPAILFLFFQPHGTGGPVNYGNVFRKVDLLFSVFDNYNRPFDVACFAVFILLLIVPAVTGRLRLAPRLGVALAVLFAAYLALPSQMMTGSGIDRRLPVALFLLLIAASAPRLSRRAAWWIGSIAGAMFFARMAVIEAVWRKADQVYAADIAVIDTLPQGAMLAVAYPPRDINAGAIPELHVATLAAARREAFVPTVFTYATQQPLALRSPYDALAAATSPSMIWNGFVGHHTSAHDASAHVLKDYDFVVFVDRAPFTVPTDRRLETRAATPTFQLLAINHDCR